MSVHELAELHELDRSLLHVFVAGPGRGEGVAVAFPGAGWLLIDGCRTAGREAGDDLPLKAVLEAWRRSAEDPVEWMVLTHPHSDHCEGFAELVDLLEPARIGLSGPPPPGRTALEVLQIWMQTSATTAQALARKQVESALLAIATWQDRHSRVLSPLHQGTRVWPPHGTAGDDAALTIDVLAPDPGLLAAVEDLSWTNFQPLANGMSTVLRLRWGALEVWLTGDLPRFHTGSTEPVPTGWDHVLAQHSELDEVAAHLKVPHHGSQPALHPGLLTWDSESPPETWVTPYSSCKLPKAGAGGGMETLLSKREHVRLTALPISRARQPPRPVDAQLTHAEYGQAIQHPDTPPHAVEVTPPHIIEPEAPIWAAAFDATGSCVGRWRGRVAFTVVP